MGRSTNIMKPVGGDGFDLTFEKVVMQPVKDKKEKVRKNRLEQLKNRRKKKLKGNVKAIEVHTFSKENIKE